MKALRIFSRSIRDSIKSVFRNFSLSLASISCITITLIIVAIAIIASFNVQNFTSEIEKECQKVIEEIINLWYNFVVSDILLATPFYSF